MSLYNLFSLQLMTAWSELLFVLLLFRTVPILFTIVTTKMKLKLRLPKAVEISLGEAHLHVV